MSKPNKPNALICDLDNTLYDWVSYFVPSFYAMVGTASEITGCTSEQLLDDLRLVHQKYRNSEHPFALLEADCVKSWISKGDNKAKLDAIDGAFYSFNSTRKRTLVLYDGVLTTLRKLSSRGIKIIAHSDSNSLAVIDRVQRLGLEEFLEKIYCTEASNSPFQGRRRLSDNFMKFPIDKIVELPPIERKPNPELLQDILKQENLTNERAIYIGDSISKDIAMAKAASVFAVWAKYGVASSGELYEKLIRISHWTAADVNREKEIGLQAKNINPNFTCESSFSEVLELF